MRRVKRFNDVARNPVERLPEQLRDCMAVPGQREKYHLDEFLRRLAEELGVDQDKAEQGASAVLAALRATVGPKEFGDVRSELPRDFDPLFDLALDRAPPSEDEVPYLGNLGYEDVVDLVAQHLHGDRDRARHALFAVLRVLAARITAGQIEDLRPYLPPQLRPALDDTPRRAVRMNLDQFLEEVARREQANRGTATEDTRAVFQVLRQIVPQKGFRDTLAQLPDDFRDVLHEP